MYAMEEFCAPYAKRGKEVKQDVGLNGNIRSPTLT